MGGEYTIKYYGNTATSGGSTTESDGELIATQTAIVGAPVKLDKNTFKKISGSDVYGMVEWNTQRNGGGTSYIDRQLLSETDSLISNIKEGETVELYAQWTNDALESYWIAASKVVGVSNSYSPIDNKYYSNPETSVVKTQSDIDDDLRVLRGEQTQTSAGKNSTEVAEEYQEFLESDRYHLYTHWNGSDATVDDNKYVEFRVMQVGAHDNDGSVLTFMAVHSLPTACQMNSEDTHDGGWTQTYMFKTLMDSYVKAGFDTSFKEQIKTVSKKTQTGKPGAWDSEIGSVECSIWIMSWREIAGEPDEAHENSYPNEGSQYDWFTANGVCLSYQNWVIATLSSNRDNCTNVIEANSWTRSVAFDTIESEHYYGIIMNWPGASSYGSLYGHTKVVGYAKITPAFAF